MNKIQGLLQQASPIVMGILNTTPDSFSDGGLFNSPEQALAHAQQMIADGVDIIDVGGESTRPGAAKVSLQEELKRVIPVIKRLRAESDIVISIDSSKPEVMAEAIQAGANLVNDVNALQADGAVNVCVDNNIPVCLMHMQGQPTNMQDKPSYENVVQDVKSFLQKRLEVCTQAGMDKKNIILDPGFGFGKTREQNYTLLKHFAEFIELGCPLLAGLSRKSMLAEVAQQTADQRIHASLAANILAHINGAKIFRVHDVKANVEALKISQTMMDAL